MKKIKYWLVYSFFLCYTADVTFVGYKKSNDGLGSLPMLFQACINKPFSCSFVNTRPDMKGHDFISPENGSKKVSILTDAISWPGGKAYKYMPNSLIKIAYSMFESDQIPAEWADILNKHFDAVVVPDDFFVQVYKSSGVTIPIFSLPIPMIQSAFFSMSVRKEVRPFIFGTSGFFTDRKNQLGLVKAFVKKFKNNPLVFLKVHGKADWFGYLQEIVTFLKQENVNNVELILKDMSESEYIKFFENINCYVLVSKGEGFSLTPRQAMAGGIPCVLTNNTAQRILCQQPFVVSVESNDLVPYFNPAFGCYCGNYFDAPIDTIAQSLEHVYNNYSYYDQQRKKIKKFILDKYSVRELAPYYKTLIAPTRIILADRDEIMSGTIYTTSQALVNKYKSLRRKKGNK